MHVCQLDGHLKSAWTGDAWLACDKKRLVRESGCCRAVLSGLTGMLAILCTSTTAVDRLRFFRSSLEAQAQSWSPFSRHMNTLCNGPCSPVCTYRPGTELSLQLPDQDSAVRWVTTALPESSLGHAVHDQAFRPHLWVAMSLPSGAECEQAKGQLGPALSLLHPQQCSARHTASTAMQCQAVQKAFQSLCCAGPCRRGAPQPAHSCSRQAGDHYQGCGHSHHCSCRTVAPRGVGCLGRSAADHRGPPQQERRCCGWAWGRRRGGGQQRHLPATGLQLAQHSVAQSQEACS